MIRLILSISIGTIMWWVGDRMLPVPPTFLELGVMALTEGVIGLALGFAISTLMSMLIIAGEVISMEMGFSMARSINPESGTNATVVSQLLQVIGMLMVFSLDLHHDALRILSDTIHACPVGQPFDFDPIWDGVRELVGGSIHLAIQFAMPIIGIMLLMSTGTVLIGRAIPSINMMEFAFGLRVLMALGVLGFYIVEAMPFVVASFQGQMDRVAEMFGG